MNLYGSRHSVLFTFAIVAVMAFAFAGALGPVHIGTMMEGDMHTCLFMQSALCSMDAVGHISEWQGAFVSLVQSFGDALTLLLLAVAMLLSFNVLARRRVPETPAFSRVRLKQRNVLQASIVDPVLAALSQGILNPKTF